MATHWNVLYRIFSLTSQVPLATYPRKVLAEKSLTLRGIFQILLRSVGTCKDCRADKHTAHRGQRSTAVEVTTYHLGPAETKLITLSSTSPGVHISENSFGRVRNCIQGGG